MKRRTKKIMLLGSFLTLAYMANNVLLEVIVPSSFLRARTRTQITEFMGARSYIEPESNKRLSALSYLRMAHFITMNNITLVDNFRDQPLDLEKTLETRKGDCAQFSQYTYANFLYIIKEKGLEELAKDVRYASGKFVDPGKGIRGGHAWLEVKIGEEWKIYETTAHDIPNNHPYFSSASVDQFNNIGCISSEEQLYKPNLKIQILLPDQRKIYYTFNGVFLSPGIIETLIKDTWLSQD